MNWMTALFQRMDQVLFGPIPAIRLRAFEISFSIAFLFYFLSRFTGYREWLCGEGFQFSPEVNLSYMIAPFAPLQPWAAWVLAGATSVATILTVAGCYKRLALIALFLVAVYIQDVNAAAAFALNKLFIVGFLLLVLSPAVQDGSAKIASAWSFRILQATILLQLFYAGACKVLHGDWLQHSDVIWSHAQGLYRTEFAALILRTLPMWGWTAFQWGALLFELVGPILILFHRTRWIGLLGAVGFVLFIATTMNDLVHFMAQIAAFLTLFISAERWRVMGTAIGRARLRFQK